MQNGRSAQTDRLRLVCIRNRVLSDVSRTLSPGKHAGSNRDISDGHPACFGILVKPSRLLRGLHASGSIRRLFLSANQLFSSLCLPSKKQGKRFPGGICILFHTETAAGLSPDLPVSSRRKWFFYWRRLPDFFAISSLTLNLDRGTRRSVKHRKQWGCRTIPDAIVPEFSKLKWRQK